MGVNHQSTTCEFSSYFLPIYDKSYKAVSCLEGDGIEFGLSEDFVGAINFSPLLGLASRDRAIKYVDIWFPIIETWPRNNIEKIIFYVKVRLSSVKVRIVLPGL